MPESYLLLILECGYLVVLIIKFVFEVLLKPDYELLLELFFVEWFFLVDPLSQSCHLDLLFKRVKIQRQSSLHWELRYTVALLLVMTVIAVLRTVRDAVALMRVRRVHGQRAWVVNPHFVKGEVLQLDNVDLFFAVCLDLGKKMPELWTSFLSFLLHWRHELHLSMSHLFWWVAGVLLLHLSWISQLRMLILIVLEVIEDTILVKNASWHIGLPGITEVLIKLFSLRTLCLDKVWLQFVCSLPIPVLCFVYLFRI